jgi:hypothetical protein
MKHYHGNDKGLIKDLVNKRVLELAQQVSDWVRVRSKVRVRG